MFHQNGAAELKWHYITDSLRLYDSSQKFSGFKFAFGVSKSSDKRISMISSKTTEIFWSGLINWTPRLLNQLNWKRESAHTMVSASSMHKIILKNNFTEFLRKNKRFRARHLNALLFTRWIYIIRWLALSRIKLVDIYIWELQHWGKGDLKIKRRGKEVVLKKITCFLRTKSRCLPKMASTRYVWEKNHDVSWQVDFNSQS